MSYLALRVVAVVVGVLIFAGAVERPAHAAGCGIGYIAAIVNVRDENNNIVGQRIECHRLTSPGHGGGGTGIGGSGGSPSNSTHLGMDGGGGFQRSNDSGNAGQSGPCEGNPVLLANGNKIEPEGDFTTSGEMPLSLTRTYNRFWSGAGLFGRHWISNFDYKLTFGTSTLNSCHPRPGGGTCSIGSALQVFAWRPDGRIVKFSKAADGVFYEDKPSPVSRVVKQADGSFRLYGEDNSIEAYNASGYVSSITNAQGLRWTFTYTGTTYLSRVTHTSGRYVQFNWSNGQLTQVRDPAGNLYNYTYSANQFGTGLHRLASTTKPGAPVSVISYHYEKSGDAAALTGKSFGGVRYSTFTYDASNRATGTEHNGTSKFTFAYATAAGGVTSTTVTNPLGKQTTYTHQNGRLVTVTGSPSTYCPLTTHVLTEYDANGYPAAEMDANGNLTTYSYNGKGQLVRMVRAEGTGVATTTTYVWDTSVNRVKQISTADLRVAYAYTSDNRIASIVETNLRAPTPANNLNQARTTTFTYTKHPNGMLASMKIDGPLPADATVTTYDALGNTLSIKNELNHATTYGGYNGLGQPGTVTGPNGDVTQYLYDARGRTTSQKTNYGGSTQSYVYTYNVFGNPSSVTSPDGTSVDFHYHLSNKDWIAEVLETRAPMMGQPAWNGTRLVRDAAGNVTQVVNYVYRNTLQPCLPAPCGPQAHEAEASPVTGVEDPPVAPSSDSADMPSLAGGYIEDVKTRTFTDYDELNRVRARRGNNGQDVRYTYDANGNVSTIRNSLNKVTTFTYDALNRVSTIKDARNGITRFKYDAGSDRIVEVSDPRGNKTSYVFDGFGQLWRQISPDTGTTSFVYDAAGRRTSMTRDSGKTASFSYDGLGRLTGIAAAGSNQLFRYDTCANGKGRLCEVTDATGNVAFTYTPQGQLASQASTMPAGGAGSIAYSYDFMGRLSTIAYPGSVTASYTYANGKPISMTASVGGTSRSIVSMAQYLPFGPATDWNYGNGLRRTHTYDLDGRKTGVSAGVIAQPPMQSLTYGYNANDEITRITNGVNAALTQTYGYDELSRLTSVAATGANQAFSYDGNGNRTSHVRNGATDTYSIATGGNRLTGLSGGTSTTFGYDADGNVTSGDGNSYTYDPFGRMATATRAGATSTYAVNGLGQRVHKKVGNTSTWFMYGPGNRMLAEYKPGQNWTNYLYFAGEPVAMARGGQVSYLHNDHLGRPELVTNSSKAAVWRASNYAFERTVTLDGIGGLNLGFPGQYWDAEIGTWNNGFRDAYDGKRGRYLQSDPIGLAGGLNTYAYVFGNPIRYVDPLGLESPGSFNNGGHQLTWERGSNVRAPDYVRVQASFYVFNASRTFSRSGNMYVAGGVARGYPVPSFRVQASISFGWLNQCETPEGSQVDGFLSGYGMAGAAGYGGVGGGVTWSPDSGTATEFGLGTGGGVSPGEVGVQDGTLGGGW